jgi:cysteine desulfurase
VHARRSAGRPGIVVAGIEHEAVLNTAKALAKDGWELATVPADADGVVDLGRLDAAVTERTAVVALMLANNETGVVQPVAACARIAHAAGAACHSDAVQAAGKIPVDVHALGVDTLALSAHKFGGPQGVGALWIRRGLTLRAQQTGGRQERNRRAGTENVAGIGAMGAAADAARAGLAAAPRIAALRDRLESGLLDAVPGAHANGAPVPRVPNTTNMSFDRVDGESLVIALDLEGIAVSTGSACSSGTLEPSHVLRAMGLSAPRVQGAVRFSLGPGTTEAEIDGVLAALPPVVERLRRLAGKAR